MKQPTGSASAQSRRGRTAEVRTVAIVPRVLGALLVYRARVCASPVNRYQGKLGSWQPSGASFTYQWYGANKKIAGATSASYGLKKADKGKRITVLVTATKSGYAAASAISKQTPRVR